MNKNYKSGFVAIIGRPNVGKSTLLNQVLGQKIVIATDKAQTTRKRIKGILTTEEGQIVFIDTPGVHKPLNKFGEFLLDEAIKVSIFLSVFDVHVNRSPIAGEITYQQYTCGGFRPAYKAAAGCENERHSLGLENDRMKVLVTQIAGILARRIVSWVTLGNVLTQGQRYGMIKFGSCTEVVMPKSVEVLVKKGDRVRGGETIIGRIME